MLKKWFALIMLGVFCSGCAANQAAFISEPAGAEVYVNGELIGTTPCSLDYHCNSGDGYQIELRKDGYEPVAQTFKADEVDQGARKTWLTAGLVWSPLWIGTLFTNKLKDSYEIIMKAAPELTAQKQASQNEPKL